MHNGVRRTDTQLEFPPGSKWMSVEGWKGSKKVVEASVTFKTGNKVEIYGKVGTDGGFFAKTGTREYRIDRLSKLPVIPPRGFRDIFVSPDGEGVFCPVGNRLKLELVRN
jgi:hypothetical protein